MNQHINLPCPCCGSGWVYAEQSEGWFIRCDYCQVAGPSAADAEKATLLWNQRSAEGACPFCGHSIFIAPQLCPHQIAVKREYVANPVAMVTGEDTPARCASCCAGFYVPETGELRMIDGGLRTLEQLTEGIA